MKLFQYVSSDGDEDQRITMLHFLNLIGVILFLSGKSESGFPIRRVPILIPTVRGLYHTIEMFKCKS